MERNFVNVIALGFGFMFLFTAFQTMGNIEVSSITEIVFIEPKIVSSSELLTYKLYFCPIHQKPIYQNEFIRRSIVDGFQLLFLRK